MRSAAALLLMTVALACPAQERPGPAALVMLTADGFSWTIPAKPAAIRYSAVVKDGTWTEVGDRVEPGKEPVRFFEMRLRRSGDSEWPGAGAISPNESR